MDRPHKSEASHDDIIAAIHDLRATTRIGLSETQSQIGVLSGQVSELTESLKRNWTATDEHGRQLMRLSTQHEIEERQRQAQTLREAHATRVEARAHHRNTEDGVVIPASVLKIAATAAVALLVLTFTVASLLRVPMPWLP